MIVRYPFGRRYRAQIQPSRLAADALCGQQVVVERIAHAQCLFGGNVQGIDREFENGLVGLVEVYGTRFDYIGEVGGEPEVYQYGRQIAVRLGYDSQAVLLDQLLENQFVLSHVHDGPVVAERCQLLRILAGAYVVGQQPFVDEVFDLQREFGVQHLVQIESGFDESTLRNLGFGIFMGMQVVALRYRYSRIPVFSPDEVEPFASLGVDGSREIEQNALYVVSSFHMRVLENNAKLPCDRSLYKVVMDI